MINTIKTWHALDLKLQRLDRIMNPMILNCNGTMLKVWVTTWLGSAGDSLDYTYTMCYITERNYAFAWTINAVLNYHRWRLRGGTMLLRLIMKGTKNTTLSKQFQIQISKSSKVATCLPSTHIYMSAHFSGFVRAPQ